MRLVDPRGLSQRLAPLYVVKGCSVWSQFLDSLLVGYRRDGGYASMGDTGFRVCLRRKHA